MRMEVEISAVFLDLPKAFDSIPHIELLKKISLTGFGNPIVFWISGYLTCREFNICTWLGSLPMLNGGQVVQMTYIAESGGLYIQLYCAHA